MDCYIGKMLEGRYRIDAHIGMGGMANVYKGFDVVEQRVVAVKILKEEYMSNGELVRRFKNEGKAIAVLAHANIVKVYDVLYGEEVQAIIMEHVDGITLKEYIESQGRIGCKEAVFFTVQILRALQHAHDKGIVHRDIKPHNIMLMRDGTIKVMDFGIARFARSENVTVTDKTIGSVHYISPEQARGGAVDEKTDIYSVGIMLFEMLTGKLPFEADSAVSVALKQIQDIPKKPRELNPEIPLGLEEITLHAMQKDVSRRYQSAAEMLRDLEAFKKDPAVTFGYHQQKVSEGTRAFTAVQGDFPEEVEEEEPINRSPAMAILWGVASSFVITALIFIGYIFFVNNPFAATGDVETPDLIGMQFETARANYGRNFEIIIESRAYSEYEEGQIFWQDPEPGRRLKSSNPTIRIKVSKGVEYITVPEDLVGSEAESARIRLRELGFEVVVVPILDEEAESGSVIKTSPQGGTKLPVQSQITIYVNEKEDDGYTEVPDVTGLTLERATELLNSYGLQVGGVTKQESPDGSNKILAQDPAHPQQVKKGEEVNLVVSVSQGTLRKLILPVKLPETVTEVTAVSAYLNGSFIEQEYFIPAEVKTWNVSFQGEGMMEVEIHIGTQLYQKIRLNFDGNSYKILEDHSSEF